MVVSNFNYEGVRGFVIVKLGNQEVKVKKIFKNYIFVFDNMQGFAFLCTL